MNGRLATENWNGGVMEWWEVLPHIYLTEFAGFHIEGHPDRARLQCSTIPATHYCNTPTLRWTF